MSFLFGMSLRGFSSLHCSLPYIQSWGMLLQIGCIYKLYKFLGLSVGLVVNGLEPDQRREAYAADIT